jgi:hypothetical protein
MRFPDNPEGDPVSVLATGKFWAATAERAVKTAAQAGIALLTTNVTGILDVDWAQAGSVIGLATAVSVLTSIASAGAGNSGPSLASEELVPPPAE